MVWNVFILCFLNYTVFIMLKKVGRIYVGQNDLVRFSGNTVMQFSQW